MSEQAGRTLEILLDSPFSSFFFYTRHNCQREREQISAKKNKLQHNRFGSPPGQNSGQNEEIAGGKLKPTATCDVTERAEELEESNQSKATWIWPNLKAFFRVRDFPFVAAAADAAAVADAVAIVIVFHTFHGQHAEILYN